MSTCESKTSTTSSSEHLTRVCKKCSISKLHSEFSRNKLCKLGIEYTCLGCKYTRTKAWAQHNPDKVTEIRKRHDSNPKNAEKIKLRWQKYALKNKEELRQKRLLNNKVNKIRCSKWYLENREYQDDRMHLWKINNPHKVKQYNNKCRQQNPGVYKAIRAKRRAAKLNATPTWLTEQHKKLIQHIYKNCPKGFEVDHIIPLQGKEVRGLHVPWNLQYLPKEVNRRKSNKVSVDIAA